MMDETHKYWDEWGVWKGAPKLRVPVAQLGQLVLDALVNIGYRASDAEVMTDVMMSAELDGNAQGVIKLYKSTLFELDKNAGEIVVERETEASALVNGNNRPGMVVLNRAVEIAMEKAKRRKFAMCGTYNTYTSTGALSYYARRIAENNFVGLIMSQNYELVAVPGGRLPVFGTNPICWSIPRTRAAANEAGIAQLGTLTEDGTDSSGDADTPVSGVSGGGQSRAGASGRRSATGMGWQDVSKGTRESDNDPLIFDMSSAAATYFQAVAAKASGTSLDRGVAIDAKGNPTTDPIAALQGALLTFGGHKGAGLALIIELLGGVLPGGAFPGGAQTKKQAKNCGSVVMVMDPVLLSDVEEFKRRVGVVCSALRQTGPEVTLPGDLESTARREALRTGELEVAQEVYNQIQELAKGKEEAQSFIAKHVTPAIARAKVKAAMDTALHAKL